MRLKSLINYTLQVCSSGFKVVQRQRDHKKELMLVWDRHICPTRIMADISQGSIWLRWRWGTYLLLPRWERSYLIQKRDISREGIMGWKWWWSAELSLDENPIFRKLNLYCTCRSDCFDNSLNQCLRWEIVLVLLNSWGSLLSFDSWMELCRGETRYKKFEQWWWYGR